MQRRVHMPRLVAGRITLGHADAHHVRDVLRLSVDAQIELFDDAGAKAPGRITRCDAKAVEVEVGRLEISQVSDELIIASAIPKGERADWMVEKLSELGVTRFVPLIAARSVVAPSGKNKLDRWRRIATESAKQSRRTGVMLIDEPCELHTIFTPSPRVRGEGVAALYLSTASGARPMLDALANCRASSLALFIGPEGGWTDDEIAMFAHQNLTPAKLTATILRVETAAVAAAAIAAIRLASEAANS